MFIIRAINVIWCAIKNDSFVTRRYYIFNNYKWNWINPNEIMMSSWSERNIFILTLCSSVALTFPFFYLIPNVYIKSKGRLSNDVMRIAFWTIHIWMTYFTAAICQLCIMFSANTIIALCTSSLWEWIATKIDVIRFFIASI